MQARLVYCSACDQDVELLVRDANDAGGSQADLDGAVCMEVGRHCAGTTCPIAAVPAVEMRARMERIRDARTE